MRKKTKNRHGVEQVPVPCSTRIFAPVILSTSSLTPESKINKQYEKDYALDLWSLV